MTVIPLLIKRVLYKLYCQCSLNGNTILPLSIQLVSVLPHILTISPREGLYVISYYYGFRGYTVLMLIAAVYPVRASYVYRFATLSIFQFFYWTISPIMSDCLLHISYGFYYVRVVCPWFIAPHLLQSLQFVIVAFSVYHLSNYFSISYAVSHDFLRSHYQRSDWLNGMHLIRWTSIAICRLRCLILWQIRSTCLWCSCPLFLLAWERIIWQATLFICYRSTRLYSGVLTYTLPIMLYVL